MRVRSDLYFFLSLVYHVLQLTVGVFIIWLNVYNLVSNSSLIVYISVNYVFTLFLHLSDILCL